MSTTVSIPTTNNTHIAEYHTQYKQQPDYVLYNGSNHYNAVIQPSGVATPITMNDTVDTTTKKIKLNTGEK